MNQGVFVLPTGHEREWIFCTTSRGARNLLIFCHHVGNFVHYMCRVRPTTDCALSVGWGDPNEDGVRCYTPDGDLLGKIHIPETVANLCFGGQQRNRLYICGSTSLYALYTSVQGAMKP